MSLKSYLQSVIMMEEPSYSDNAGSLGPSQHYKNKCKDRGTRLPLVSVPGVD